MGNDIRDQGAMYMSEMLKENLYISSLVSIQYIPVSLNSFAELCSVADILSAVIINVIYLPMLKSISLFHCLWVKS